MPHLIPWTIAEKQKVPTDAMVTYLYVYMNKIKRKLPALHSVYIDVYTAPAGMLSAPLV